MSPCSVPGCRGTVATRTQYVPIGEDRYLEQTVVDLDAWRAHLLSAHVAPPRERLQVAS